MVEQLRGGGVIGSDPALVDREGLLVQRVGLAVGAGATAVAREQAGAAGDPQVVGRQVRGPQRERLGEGRPGIVAAAELLEEIGRASCRERVYACV